MFRTGKKDDYDDPAPPPANERHGALSSSLPRDGGGGDGIPWGKRGSPASGVDGIDASGAQDGGGFDAQQSDLGWAGDDFASEPEIQMQVLAEVGRLVRAAAAARRRDHNETHCEHTREIRAISRTHILLYPFFFVFFLHPVCCLCAAFSGFFPFVAQNVYVYSRFPFGMWLTSIPGVVAS